MSDTGITVKAIRNKRRKSDEDLETQRSVNTQGRKFRSQSAKLGEAGNN